MLKALEEEWNSKYFPLRLVYLENTCRSAIISSFEGRRGILYNILAKESILYRYYRYLTILASIPYRYRVVIYHPIIKRNFAKSGDERPIFVISTFGPARGRKNVFCHTFDIYFVCSIDVELR